MMSLSNWICSGLNSRSAIASFIAAPPLILLATSIIFLSGFVVSLSLNRFQPARAGFLFMIGDVRGRFGVGLSLLLTGRVMHAAARPGVIPPTVYAGRGSPG